MYKNRRKPFAYAFLKQGFTSQKLTKKKNPKNIKTANKSLFLSQSHEA